MSSIEASCTDLLHDGADLAVDQPGGDAGAAGGLDDKRGEQCPVGTGRALGGGPPGW